MKKILIFLTLVSIATPSLAHKSITARLLGRAPHIGTLSYKFYHTQVKKIVPKKVIKNKTAIKVNCLNLCLKNCKLSKLNMEKKNEPRKCC